MSMIKEMLKLKDRELRHEQQRLVRRISDLESELSYLKLALDLCKANLAEIANEIDLRPITNADEKRRDDLAQVVYEEIGRRSLYWRNQEEVNSNEWTYKPEEQEASTNE